MAKAWSCRDGSESSGITIQSGDPGARLRAGKLRRRGTELEAGPELAWRLKYEDHGQGPPSPGVGTSDVKWPKLIRMVISMFSSARNPLKLSQDLPDQTQNMPTIWNRDKGSQKWVIFLSYGTTLYSSLRS